MLLVDPQAAARGPGCCGCRWRPAAAPPAVQEIPWAPECFRCGGQQPGGQLHMSDAAADVPTSFRRSTRRRSAAPAAGWPRTSPTSSATRPMVRLRSFDRDVPGHRDLGQVRVHEPGRLGQGSRRLPDDQGRHRLGPADPGQGDHRLVQRQHRHRLLADRRRAGLQGDAGAAGQRVLGPAQDQRGVRHEAGVLQQPRGLGRRHPPVPRDGRRGSRALLLPQPVRQRVQPARALRDHRAARSGSRPAAGSPTSSPASAPAARSWAPAGA